VLGLPASVLHAELRGQGPAMFSACLLSFSTQELLLAHAKADGYARCAEALTGSKQEGAQDASERRMIVR